MRNFKNLDVWEKSHKFILATYKIIDTFPKKELFSLSYQFRKAVVSICANIAEGYGKYSDKEKINFLRISFGSCCECEYYLILARDLHYFEKEKYNELYSQLEEIKKMLTGLIKSIRNENAKENNQLTAED